MTALNAPRTVLAAVERDLTSLAFGAAMDLALSTTAAGSPERIKAVRAAQDQLEKPRFDEAMVLIDYLNEYWGTSIAPLSTRHGDDRAPAEIRVVDEHEQMRRTEAGL